VYVPKFATRWADIFTAWRFSKNFIYMCKIMGDNDRQRASGKWRGVGKQAGGRHMAKPKINTMAELSEAIGVSRPTLSRYFQSPDTVLGKTAEKIRLGLEQVEYVPNFFATRMNRKTTGIIGVIIPY
jgi:hypothetical protein